jgi:carbon-monoxide dehydrogenase large subunit
MLPTLETARTVTPTLLNPLGAKGIGDRWRRAAGASFTNAIIDALAPFGVTHLEMPLKPEKLWWLMHQGTQAGTRDRHASAARLC